MDINLLRAKMALAGDTKASDLAKVLGMDYQRAYKRLNGSVAFKTEEIKTISEHYHLTSDEVVKIFDLGAEMNEGGGGSEKAAQV